MTPALKTSPEITPTSLPVQETDLGEHQGKTLQKVDSVLSRDINNNAPHFCESGWTKRFERPIVCAVVILVAGLAAAAMYGIATLVRWDMKRALDEAKGFEG